MARADIGVERSILLPGDLPGDLHLPAGAGGLVVFVHGSGSSRHSPRNLHVAQAIRDAGLGTLLFDLMSQEEESFELFEGTLRFDMPVLAGRLLAATDWVAADRDTRGLPLGYFGASTGGGAALVAAAERPEAVQAVVRAVVARGGRPDLAGEALARVEAATLLLVGGADPRVIEINRGALERLSGVKDLVVVPGATHLFEEPGALDEVARHAAAWFARYLAPRGAAAE
jgi:putative phosphoribosyl transferase